MKNTTKHQGLLQIIKREPSSFNGNPRYCVTINNITCYTAPDSSIAYTLPNYNKRQVEAIIGPYYGKPTIKSIKLVDPKKEN